MNIVEYWSLSKFHNHHPKIDVQCTFCLLTWNGGQERDDAMMTNGLSLWRCNRDSVVVCWVRIVIRSTSGRWPLTFTSSTTRGGLGVRNLRTFIICEHKIHKTTMKWAELHSDCNLTFKGSFVTHISLSASIFRTIIMTFLRLILIALYFCLFALNSLFFLCMLVYPWRYLHGVSNSITNRIYIYTYTDLWPFPDSDMFIQIDVCAYPIVHAILNVNRSCSMANHLCLD